MVTVKVSPRVGVPLPVTLTRQPAHVWIAFTDPVGGAPPCATSCSMASHVRSPISQTSTGPALALMTASDDRPVAAGIARNQQQHARRHFHVQTTAAKQYGSRPLRGRPALRRLRVRFHHG